LVSNIRRSTLATKGRKKEGDCMKLQNKELHDMYSTKHYLGDEMEEDKSHVVEMRNVYTILLRNLKRSLYLGVYGRIMLK
jgi:Tfp pilus assembly protein PilO